MNVTNRHLLAQSQQWKHQNNVRNLFKDNKDQNDIDRFLTLFLCFHCCLWTNQCWLGFSSVVTIDFDHISFGWCFSFNCDLNYFDQKILFVFDLDIQRLVDYLTTLFQILVNFVRSCIAYSEHGLFFFLFSVICKVQIYWSIILYHSFPVFQLLGKANEIQACFLKDCYNGN